MFDKEAREYAEKKICQEYTDGCMGFYKCKEDCERYHNTQKYWKDGAEFGFNKANEWHCLTKDPNDLPKEQGQYLVLADFFCKYYDVMTESEVKMHSEHIIKWCKLPKE